MNPKKIVRKVLPKSAVRVAEEGYRKGRLGAVNVRYGLPTRNLKVIAVTGTNGKTTTCLLINSILKTAGYKTAMFTTAVIEIDGRDLRRLGLRLGECRWRRHKRGCCEEPDGGCEL